jgi:hypothetical protein
VNTDLRKYTVRDIVEGFTHKELEVEIERFVNADVFDFAVM